ncbi:hypothetical protein L5L55_03145 [Shewanella glacialipiscicola]|uniref:hypothetical protein n=1 Tax=Shewanella glacialipiscicola TaxID=614069 RepID=UPI0021D9160A|nr:hypothetical protein [Shewanella glacialipiscicola]MCU7993913.1 hypothetical protein [Shewanella glacialipiscicola]MCU8025231.1 hypothetical protein [Shewanella glacialipiscicola]
MSPTVTVATMPIFTNPLAARLAKKLLPQSKIILSSVCSMNCHYFPVTRRKYIPIGSTAASMPPTVTGITMPILI